MALNPASASPKSARDLRAGLRWLIGSFWGRCLLLAFCGFVVRLPALSGELLWDDQYLARDNPFMKSPLLLLEAFRHHLFLDSFSGHYRPVQNASFVLDYFLWNTNTFGFHLTNVLLHLGSGLLLFALLRKLLVPAGAEPGAGPGPDLVAFLVALLWLVHPVHSAAVDYISGRADSLSFLFGSAAWLIVLRANACARGELRLAGYLAAFLCGLLALCSREIACVWVIIFAVHTCFLRPQISWRTRLAVLACALLLLGTYVGLRQLPGSRSAENASHGWTAPTRAVLVFRALGDYGRLMLYPANLHMERTVVDPANYRGHQSWRGSVRSEYLSLGGLLCAGLAAWGCARRGRGHSLRVLGVVWFLAAFFPISNVVDLNASVAEHWLYLPSVGFLLFLAGAALDLPVRYHRHALVVALVAATGFGARSYVRSTDWVTPETFYQRTLAAGGRSTRVAVNLAQIYAARGEYGRAEKMYREVLQLLPGYPIARNNLADVLFRQGKRAEAEKIFAESAQAAEQARKDYPRTWIAALNLAHLRFKENPRAALPVLERARHDYPGIWELVSFQAEVVRMTEGPDAALRLVEEYARKNWWHYGAAVALGRVYAEQDDIPAAEKALRHASRLDIHEVQALNLMAGMKVRQNRLEEARRLQERAVSRQPDQPRQLLILSDILERMGRTQEARLALARVGALRAAAE